ncbi:MAG: hypothetical protein JO295_14500 [Verrucomicrobia bacterium]|nr:hypothetical protein [Verrucomicrobiota bacterium]
MPLDFAILDESGRPTSYVAISLTLWDNISLATCDMEAFPLLSRMRDYYSDVVFDTTEVPMLAAEIESVMTALSAWRTEIEQLLKLCRVASAKGFRVMAIAD